MTDDKDRQIESLQTRLDCECEAMCNACKTIARQKEAMSEMDDRITLACGGMVGILMNPQAPNWHGALKDVLDNLMPAAQVTEGERNG